MSVHLLIHATTHHRVCNVLSTMLEHLDWIRRRSLIIQGQPTQTLASKDLKCSKHQLARLSSGKDQTGGTSLSFWHILHPCTSHKSLDQVYQVVKRSAGPKVINKGTCNGIESDTLELRTGDEVTVHPELLSVYPLHLQWSASAAHAEGTLINFPTVPELV